MRLTIVSDELEAKTLCGRLRASRIACAYRKTDVAAAISAYGGGFATAGPTEVLVDERDLGKAQKLLRRRRHLERPKAGLIRGT